MAKFWTYQEIQNKIYRDMDLEAEDFIQADEFLELVNEAIDEAEADIHTLGLDADYFLTYTTLDLTQGDTTLTLPADIYENKIKSIMYSNDSLIYPIRRFRSGSKFEEIERRLHFSNSGAEYQYVLYNDGTDGNANPAPKLLLIPQARETKTGVIKLWYIREAKRMTGDVADICDLPEMGLRFVIKYVKYWVYFKEGHPNVASAKVEMETARERMNAVLATMIPDQDTRIVPDTTFYNDMN